LAPHLKESEESKMITKRTPLTLALLLLLVSALLVNSNSARSQEPVNATDLHKAGKEAERALSAANILTEIMKTPESSIPEDLMERAHAIAVIPNLVKGAFGVGGAHGKGLIVKRLGGHRWGTPAFIDLNGGSFGLQIGVSVTDLILVFTGESGLKGLYEDKLELGGEAGAAAGPAGRAAEAGTNLTFDSPIYSYSRSKGLFAGIALKGTVMTIDDSANQKVYGANVTGRQILVDGKVPSSPVVKPFLVALNKEVPSRADKEVKKAKSVAASDGVPVTRSPLSRSGIRSAQESLRDKGYYQGTIDGIIGPKTRNAIREFQRAERLPISGHLDTQTAAKLGLPDKSVGQTFQETGESTVAGTRDAGPEIAQGK
jgi:lipid-binding SYLF domain-containing protein